MKVNLRDVSVDKTLLVLLVVLFLEQHKLRSTLSFQPHPLPSFNIYFWLVSVVEQYREAFTSFTNWEPACAQCYPFLVFFFFSLFCESWGNVERDYMKWCCTVLKSCGGISWEEKLVWKQIKHLSSRKRTFFFPFSFCFKQIHSLRTKSVQSSYWTPGIVITVRFLPQDEDWWPTRRGGQKKNDKERDL